MNRPDQTYDNFRMLLPPSTHRQPATCEEVECQAWREGFSLEFPATDHEMETRATYVRRFIKDRRFAELARRAGEVTVVDWRGLPSESINLKRFRLGGDATVFAFPPGERCFKEHTQLNGRPPVLRFARGRLWTLQGGRTVDQRVGERSVDEREFHERMNEDIARFNEARGKG